MLTTFGLAVIGWVIFRADNIEQAFHYLSRMFSSSTFSLPQIIGSRVIFTILILLVVEWVGRRNLFALEHMPKRAAVRYTLYFIVVALILWAGDFGSNQFIYFQF